MELGEIRVQKCFESIVVQFLRDFFITVLPTTSQKALASVAEQISFLSVFLAYFRIGELFGNKMKGYFTTNNFLKN